MSNYGQAKPTIAELRAIIRAKDATIRELQHPLGRDSYACERCGLVSGLDASVANSVWKAIATKDDSEFGILCLWCMERIASERNIEGTVYLYFPGNLHSALYNGDDDERWPEIIDARDATIRELQEEQERLREILGQIGTTDVSPGTHQRWALAALAAADGGAP